MVSANPVTDTPRHLIASGVQFPEGPIALREGGVLIAPDGTLLRQVPVPGPDPFVTNIRFAGADSPTTFATSSGRGLLDTQEWPTPDLDLECAA